MQNPRKFFLFLLKKSFEHFRPRLMVILLWTDGILRPDNYRTEKIKHLAKELFFVRQNNMILGAHFRKITDLNDSDDY